MFLRVYRYCIARDGKLYWTLLVLAKLLLVSNLGLQEEYGFLLTQERVRSHSEDVPFYIWYCLLFNYCYYYSKISVLAEAEVSAELIEGVSKVFKMYLPVSKLNIGASDFVDVNPVIRCHHAWYIYPFYIFSCLYYMPGFHLEEFKKPPFPILVRNLGVYHYESMGATHHLFHFIGYIAVKP